MLSETILITFKKKQKSDVAKSNWETMWQHNMISK